MPRKKKEVSLHEMLRKLKDAGMENAKPPNRKNCDLRGIQSIDERVHKLVEVVRSPNRGKGNMLFFVMYDIESNKVRHQIAKYLERMGCTRVQNSVFLADIDSSKYNQIRDDLAEVQACYDNHDSILICPVSTELIKNMRIIGKNINISIITRSESTLFF